MAEKRSDFLQTRRATANSIKRTVLRNSISISSSTRESSLEAGAIKFQSDNRERRREHHGLSSSLDYQKANSASLFCSTSTVPVPDYAVVNMGFEEAYHHPFCILHKFSLNTAGNLFPLLFLYCQCESIVATCKKQKMW